MFACCMGLPEVQDEDPLVVDLDKVLQDHVWENFTSTLGMCQRKFVKRKNFDIEVPENFYVFEQISQEISPRKELRVPQGGDSPKPTRDQSGSDANSTANAVSNNNQSRLPNQKDVTSPEVVTLDTEFSNDTADTQTYKFRFEKTRKTEINVSFQKGFTVRGKANFSIGVPKVLGDGSVGVETEMQYQVTKSQGQRFEESMLMETTSDITVGPDSHYTACVELEERALNANFTIVTRMSLPQGRVPVYIRRKSDAVLVHVFTIDNIGDVFCGRVPCARRVKDPEKAESSVDFIVEGVLKGMVACNHRIMLKSDESLEAKSKAKAQHFNPVTTD